VNEMCEHLPGDSVTQRKGAYDFCHATLDCAIAQLRDVLFCCDCGFFLRPGRLTGRLVAVIGSGFLSRTLCYTKDRRAHKRNSARQKHGKAQWQPT
jgi:hypothetical protein